MKNIASVKFKNKKVLVRVDYNVPIKDGKIMDDTRIVASLKTLNLLIEGGAKVILLSHLGRVKSEEDMMKNSLSIVAKRLSKLISAPVYFIPKTRGHIVEETIDNLLPGEIALIENTRFEDYPKKLESSCDEALSKYWASLADMFVLDAFGTAHRCHASTYGISKFIPSYAGYLVEKETAMLDEALSSKRTLIMGGAKVDDKIGVIDNLIKTSDKLLIGGAMCFTFLKANGIDVGSSLVSEEYIDYAKNVLKKYSKKIVLPVDVVCESGIKDIDKLEKDDVGYDIGPKTIELFRENLENSKMVLWNGPLGKYEEKAYENGTKEILKYLSDKDKIVVIGGGDTASAAINFGYKDSFTHISTGGGASLELLEGKKLPAIEIIENI